MQQLLARHRILTLFGMALILFAVPCLMLQWMDGRVVDGVNIWVKPTKFLFSIGVFALTTAWFMGYVRPERRGSRLMRIMTAILIISACFELAYILWQAAHAQKSHFNFASPATIALYILMGLFAVSMVSTTLFQAWEIARRPAQGLAPDFVAAVVIGLVLTFILGGGYGAYMSAGKSHAVGAIGGAVPFFGWNRSGGDLRIAHFMGIHAQQAIPILAFMIAGLRTKLRWILLGLGAIAYTGISTALFLQAVAGKPLWPV